MKTKKYNNSKFNNSNNNKNPYGLNKKTKMGLRHINSHTAKRKSIGFTLSLDSAKLTKKYLKKCKKGEEQYDPYPPPKPMPSERKIIDWSKPLDFAQIGFVIPVISEIYKPIMVKKMRRPKCYKEPTVIPNNSVELNGKCFKDSQCKQGACDGSLFGIKSGKCKLPRKKENVEEGGDCRLTNECAKGLKCVNNMGGLKIGVCIEDTKK